MIEKIAEFMGWEKEPYGYSYMADDNIPVAVIDFDPLHDWNHWKKIVEPRIREKEMWGEYINALEDILDPKYDMALEFLPNLLMSADLEQRAQALMRVLEGMDE